MSLRHRLVSYTREARESKVVNKLIEAAKSGKYELEVSEEELEWGDLQYMRDEGLILNREESKVNIYWGV